MQRIKIRPNFIHYKKSKFLYNIREIVFGVEDGMLSTLGALTGIAAGSNNHFFIILSGFVIVIVEAISMGIGSYLSTKSVKEVNERKLEEEKIEIEENPEEERKELIKMYTRDGWPLTLAKEMALVASKNKSLFLKEMMHRELFTNLGVPEKPIHSGIFMFFSYIIGGSLPVLPYLFLPVSLAMIISITITLIGLFVLGSITTKFTKRRWWKSGFEMFILASIATLAGYVIGVFVNSFIMK
ncbi:MAG: VIT1/CCC1 transporter family protein [Candidatus Nealsonbacteria bacterium]